jgi:hypothetical protein
METKSPFLLKPFALSHSNAPQLIFHLVYSHCLVALRSRAAIGDVLYGQSPIGRGRARHPCARSQAIQSIIGYQLSQMPGRSCLGGRLSLGEPAGLETGYTAQVRRSDACARRVHCDHSDGGAIPEWRGPAGRTAALFECYVPCSFQRRVTSWFYFSARHVFLRRSLRRSLN